MSSLVLERQFYRRSPRAVARELLGATVVRHTPGGRMAGTIVETEAYCDSGERDLACHGDRANGGHPTDRTRVMFGPAGHAYVYFTYGMHWMLNVVTGAQGVAGAVLLRALEPTAGLDLMGANRGRKRDLTNGPARLAQALAIDHGWNGADLCVAGADLLINGGERVPEEAVATGPRIGLGKTPEPWLSAPWRYWIRDNGWVSR